MSTPFDPSLGRVQGQRLIEQAAEELGKVVELLVDETDNKEQILEFITQVVEVGGSVFKLKSAFTEEQLPAVGAHLGLAISGRLISLFVPAPIPQEIPGDLMPTEEDD